jgi:acyl dehydratase
MAEFVVTEKLKSLVGTSVQMLVYKVEEGSIQRYARAVGDNNLLHTDVEYAAHSKFRALKAPPSFAGWPVTSSFDMFQIVETLIAAGAPRGNLDGGVEYEFHAPIVAGDTLVAVIKIDNIEGKETRMGPTMLTTVKSTYTNQNGQLVLTAQNQFLSF